ncbi:alpha/beta fold hydrolase [Caballeronia telluris]|uniref:alpha/beta fold hydrolase n=1 Tax=Caballeronia telluris TaxID=326475 RepID=UPI00389962A5
MVAADLRGYGDSSKPPGDAAHANYAKRRMALDQIELMRRLGHETCAVIGHDRGGRVAARMALDHPQAVTRLCRAHTRHVRTDLVRFRARLLALVHAGEPRALPGDADPRKSRSLSEAHHRSAQRWPGVVHAGGLRGISTLPLRSGDGARHLEDFRASVTIDLEHDRATLASQQRIGCPFMALWGRRV